MNEVHISGWVFKQETRKLSSGKDLIRFSLKYGNGKDKDGKWQNAFIPVKIFADGLTIADGQFIVNTAEKSIYVDVGAERLRIGDFVLKIGCSAI